ncbi:MAG: RNA methyltransferase [Tenericutes bacterium]|jgi:RNA methyltransferase, TrmH family|nr:RNA methyltransferase [Mycoplasmatota bacterium]
MKLITSRQNSSFKLWKNLKVKKYRDIHDMFLVYGKHLIEKAKEKNAIVEIITSNDQQEGTLIDKKLMDELQQTETSFDQIAICKKTNPEIQSNKILILDDVQDPDNVGALIRSAAAFGFLHVMVSLKSADFYNEKVIRASKGAIFDVYLERRPLNEAINALKDKGYQIVCADAHEKKASNKKNRIALILGNEGHGISQEIKELADATIQIPTQNVESLNVSVAGGILMYEWRAL